MPPKPKGGAASAASRKGEQAVLSRRLKPIYDAIDAGQNKKAAQEADKVLKKHPSTQGARALKALALVRLDKASEAAPLMSGLEEEVRAGDFDENLLQAMSHCYKELYEPERIVSLYEVAVKKTPADEMEQCLTQLFMSYARIRNYKQQQRVGMQLYKEFPSAPHYMWTVMSIVMQALCDPALAGTMFYPLAEKMLQKIQEQHTFQAEEADLHLMVLEARGKLAEAIDFLGKNPITAGVGAIPGTREKHRLNQLYKRAGKHRAVMARALCALEEEYDDWANWTLLFDAEFTMLDEATRDASSDANECETMRRRTVSQLAEVCLRFMQLSEAVDDTDLIKRRSAQLAALELMSRVHNTDAYKIAHDRLGSPLSLISNLISNIDHSKPFCYSDIRPYLHLLLGDGDERRQLIEHVGSSDSIWAKVLKARLKLALGAMDEGAVLEVWELLQGIDQQNCQDAGTLVAVLLGWLWQRSGSEEAIAHLHDSILLLEWAMQKYKSCDAEIPLLLACLYSVVGGVERVGELCRQLDIKHVQRDSLGHLQFGLAQRFGLFKSAILYYTSMSNFYDQCDREVSECIVNAYKGGQFSQIPKLVELAEHCSHSAFALGTDVMNRWLSACFAIEDLKVAAETLAGDGDEIEWSSMVDNRDFDLLLSAFEVNALESRAEKEQRRERLVQRRKAALDLFKTALEARHYACRVVGLVGLLAVQQREGITPQQCSLHVEKIRTAIAKFGERFNGLQHLERSETHGGSRLQSFLIPLGLLHAKQREWTIANLRQLGEIVDVAEGAIGAKFGGGPTHNEAETTNDSQQQDGADALSGADCNDLPEQIERAAGSLECIALSHLALTLLMAVLESGSGTADTQSKSAESTARDVGKWFKTLEQRTALIKTSLARLKEKLDNADVPSLLPSTHTHDIFEKSEFYEAKRLVADTLRKSYSQSVEEMLKVADSLWEKLHHKSTMLKFTDLSLTKSTANAK